MQGSLLSDIDIDIDIDIVNVIVNVNENVNVNVNKNENVIVNDNGQLLWAAKKERTKENIFACVDKSYFYG